MIVLLDMDGVLADFTRHALKILGHNDEQIVGHLDNWHTRDHSIVDQLGITHGHFWGMMNAVPDFWLEIPIFDHAKRLVRELRKENQVYICSAPNSDDACSTYKLKWLRKHKLGFNRDFVFTPQKWLLAGPGKILIDDSTKNIQLFNDHGGHGLMFPQPWNTSSHIVGDKVDYVMAQIEEIKASVE